MKTAPTPGTIVDFKLEHSEGPFVVVDRHVSDALEARYQTNAEVRIVSLRNGMSYAPGIYRLKKVRVVLPPRKRR